MLNERIELLAQTYRHIAATRMKGVPVLHSALQVRAVGFAPQVDDPGWALGVLVTPWFMNLLRLPITALPDGVAASHAGCLAVGRDQPREIGAQALYFMGAHQDRLGHFEQCSLYSPMFHFADQAAAVATAAEVMTLLRNPPTAATPRPAPAGAATAPVPARRGFLLGRPRGGAANPAA